MSAASFFVDVERGTLSLAPLEPLYVCSKEKMCYAPAGSVPFRLPYP